MPNDEAFLLRVYASTRSDVAMFGWEESQQRIFIRMQFEMQTRAYAMQYPGAEQSIILHNEEPAGRVIVYRTPSAIQLTDISVLHEKRGCGIATTIIERLQDEAALGGRPVELTVDKMNPDAFRLYQKLGFVVTGESQIDLLMQWTPNKRT